MAIDDKHKAIGRRTVSPRRRNTLRFFQSKNGIFQVWLFLPDTLARGHRSTEMGTHRLDAMQIALVRATRNNNIDEISRWLFGIEGRTVSAGETHRTDAGAITEAYGIIDSLNGKSMLFRT